VARINWRLLLSFDQQHLSSNDFFLRRRAALQWDDLRDIGWLRFGD